MKAWVVAKNGDPAKALVLQETDAAAAAAPPVPKGADIVVRVSHAALNPADLHFILNIPTWVPFRRRATPGLDFAGEVVALGPQAAAAPAHAEAPLAVGARVAGCMSVGMVATGHGSLAEYVCVPADLVARLPAADLKIDTSAAVGMLGCAGQTAHLVLTDPAAEAVFAAADPKKGPRILINGASGGVGTLLIQAARARGASFIAAVCSAANAALVTSLGADVAIDYRATPLPAYLADAFPLDKEPFDLILDCVGDQALFTHSPAYLAPRGAVLCIVGGPTQGVVPFVRNKLVPTMLGGTPRTYKLLALLPSGAQARAVAAWLADGTLKTMPIDSEYNMADVVKVGALPLCLFVSHPLTFQAYEKLATKRSRGKIIIKVQE